MRRLSFMILVLALGCSGRSQEDSSAHSELKAPPQASAELSVAPQARRATRLSALRAPTSDRASSPADRMIVRQASISLVVQSAPTALRRIQDLVESRGGYIAETKQWRENDQIRATAVFRVPENRLFEVLPEIRKGVIRVESESLTGEDVSEEFSDLGAQLRNVQATETELRELLATVRQRTQKAADVLEVYTELAKVRGEAERIQGRMKYLTQMTAMATIQLSLVPDVLAKPVVEPGWRPLAVVKSSSRALLGALKWLVEGVIWVAILFVPLALVGAGMLALLRMLWVRLTPLRARLPRPQKSA